MHELTPDFSIWADDLIDPNTRQPIEVVDGAIGLGLMTDLKREAGPVLKYWYGDIIRGVRAADHGADANRSDLQTTAGSSASPYPRGVW